ncbi:MAG: SPOR domain-containing protein, partial [Acidobacteriota bacterium]
APKEAPKELPKEPKEQPAGVDTVKGKPKPAPVAEPVPAPAAPPQPEKQPVPQVAAHEPEPPAAAAGGEHYTLLVASQKDKDSAERLFNELKSKGYNPKIESLDLNGGKWVRLTVGSFESREAAQKFSSEFNRKERREALIVRESQ